MQMPDPVSRAFVAGVDAGYARASREDLVGVVTTEGAVLALESINAALAEPVGLARELLAAEGVSPRFAELFAEMLTVVVIARHAYQDEPLSEYEIQDYLQRSFSIFNSFRHA